MNEGALIMTEKGQWYICKYHEKGHKCLNTSGPGRDMDVLFNGSSK